MEVEVKKYVSFVHDFLSCRLYTLPFYEARRRKGFEYRMLSNRVYSKIFQNSQFEYVCTKLIYII